MYWVSLTASAQCNILICAIFDSPPLHADVKTCPIPVHPLHAKRCTAQPRDCAQAGILFVYTPYVNWQWWRIRILRRQWRADFLYKEFDRVPVVTELVVGGTQYNSFGQISRSLAWFIVSPNKQHCDISSDVIIKELCIQFWFCITTFCFREV